MAFPWAWGQWHLGAGSDLRLMIPNTTKGQEARWAGKRELYDYVVCAVCVGIRLTT